MKKINYKELFQKAVNWLKSLNRREVYILIIALVAILWGFKSYIDKHFSSYIQKQEVENQHLRTLIENDKKEIADTKKLIERLEKETDEKDEIIKRLEENEAQLADMYYETNLTLSKIKSQYEKINRVDNFNSDDIRRYFSDNYGKK